MRKIVDLSRRGREEALEAGRLLKSHEYSFDFAYTSLLKRAIRTLWFVLDELDLMWIPVEKSWRLNERHYGALQGLNKAATAKRYSVEQVHLWRRSYDVPPPALTKDDRRHPVYLDGISYADISELEIPTGIPLVYELDESLRPLARYYLGDSPLVAEAQEALDHLVGISVHP